MDGYGNVAIYMDGLSDLPTTLHTPQGTALSLHQRQTQRRIIRHFITVEPPLLDYQAQSLVFTGFQMIVIVKKTLNN